jgi:hypothetical protein
MSVARDSSLKALSGYGCCQGVSVETPLALSNRPGMSAIAYRVGTHSRFKESLLARLSSKDYSPLQRLTTRDGDDFTIALLDAWSTTADALTFYQERIANEAFLRTATERLSTLEMARLIGYELAPGVAASAYLAIEIEAMAGAFGQALASGNAVQAPLQPSPPVTVETGLKMQSIPGPDEDPQMFETIEAIEARAEWNAIKPQLTQLRLPAFEDIFVYLEGVATNLQEGSAILIVGLERIGAPTNDNWEFRRISKVETDTDNDRTKITFDRPLGSSMPKSLPPEKSPRVYALRLRASLFGHNAPDWDALPVALRIGEVRPDNNVFEAGAFAGKKSEWADANFDATRKSVDLDSVYSVAVGSWVVLSKSRYAELYEVKSVADESRTRFNISGKSTRLTIDGENIDKFSPRNAAVFAQSEELELAEIPISTPVEADQIVVDGRFDELPAGRVLLLKGKRMRLQLKEDAPAQTLTSQTDASQTAAVAPADQLIVLSPAIPGQNGASERTWMLEDESGFQGALTIADSLVELVAAGKEDDDVAEKAGVREVIAEDKTHSRLVLSEPLANVYDRTTLVIFGNVAPATHGETVKEILGNGDGGKVFQSFTLKQPPLTHVSAATPSGSQSTLEVRVNDILWEEVATFYGRGPSERIYVTQRDDDGNTKVIFGNGVQGARLPTGQANIIATYRKGIGLGGNLNPGQLSLLMSRPLGVKSGVNPLAAEGAEDPDELEETRANAPITILTLDRIVSLRDFEDFARAFAGVNKALATSLWIGQKQSVFLTIAGPDGAEISKESATYENLVAAIVQYGDPRVNVIVRSYRQRFFRIQGRVTIEPDRLVEDIQPSIEENLRNEFSFTTRAFGQPVALSEVIAAIHSVDGVRWVDINLLYRSDEPAELHPLLGAALAQVAGAVLSPAELLTLDTVPLDLEVTL